ncbi:MAG: hypothetical protein ACR2RE_27520 [Geminicoccaceae bacterium]
MTEARVIAVLTVIAVLGLSAIMLWQSQDITRLERSVVFLESRENRRHAGITIRIETLEGRAGEATRRTAILRQVLETHMQEAEVE